MSDVDEAEVSETTDAAARFRRDNGRASFAVAAVLCATPLLSCALRLCSQQRSQACSSGWCWHYLALLWRCWPRCHTGSAGPQIGNNPRRTRPGMSNEHDPEEHEYITWHAVHPRGCELRRADTPANAARKRACGMDDALAEALVLALEAEPS